MDVDAAGHQQTAVGIDGLHPAGDDQALPDLPGGRRGQRYQDVEGEREKARVGLKQKR